MWVWSWLTQSTMKNLAQRQTQWHVVVSGFRASRASAAATMMAHDRSLCKCMRLKSLTSENRQFFESGVWSSLPLHETESCRVAIVNINCYKFLKLPWRGNSALFFERAKFNLSSSQTDKPVFVVIDTKAAQAYL